MTNEEAINVLTLHKENWERLLREHIAEQQEGNEMVEALGKAIEALRKQVLVEKMNKAYYKELRREADNKD